MRTSMSLEVAVQHPETESGRAELARRVAEIHADFVVQTLRQLDCPTRQKLELLQAVLRTVPEPSEKKQAASRDLGS